MSKNYKNDRRSCDNFIMGSAMILRYIPSIGYNIIGIPRALHIKPLNLKRLYDKKEKLMENYDDTKGCC